MTLLTTVIMSSLVIILALLIRRNALRSDKKKYGNLINAKVTEWKVLSGKPTRYILEVEYEIKNRKQRKRLITSGKFARKYEKLSQIPIVVIQNTNKIYLEEEDWKRQNMVLFLLIMIALPTLIILIFCCFLEIMKWLQYFMT